MISALVLSPSLHAGAMQERAAEAVARSLGSLVRAAVEGILRDVAIVGPPNQNLAQVADHAGCDLVETFSTQEGFLRAAAHMRADYCFVLEGGYAPPSAFVEEIDDLMRARERFCGALLRVAPDRLVTRLAPGLARPVGALAEISALRAAAPRDLADLIRRLKIKRALNARAFQMI